MYSEGIMLKSDKELVVIDESWSITIPAECSIIVKTGAEDLQSYLKREKGLDLEIKRIGKVEEQEKVILVVKKGELGVAYPETREPESYGLEVDENRIVICGFDDRGAIYGIYYLEDLMSFRDDVKVEKVKLIKKPLFRWRFATDFTLKFPDENLSFLSHVGVNCLYIHIFPFMEQLVPSDILPEDGVNIVRKEEDLEKVKDICRRAEKYGLDCYIYVRDTFPLTPKIAGPDKKLFMRPFPGYLENEIFNKFPEIRGSAANIEPKSKGWDGGEYLRSYGSRQHYGSDLECFCFSSPLYKSFIKETCKNLFREIPNLKGTILELWDGMLWCDDSCPRCKDKSLISRWAEFTKIIDESAKSVREDAETVVYPWGMTWNKAKRKEYISKIPRDTIVWCSPTDGAKQYVDGEYIHDFYWFDWSISVSEPGESYLTYLEAAKDTGKKPVVHLAVGPYPPVPFINSKQFEYGKKHGLEGYYAADAKSLCRSITAEIVKWSTWEDQKTVEEEILPLIAKVDYGEAAAPLVIEGWKKIGEAHEKIPEGDYFFYWMEMAVPKSPLPLVDNLADFVDLMNPWGIIPSRKLSDVGYLQNLMRCYIKSEKIALKALDLFKRASKKAVSEKQRTNLEKALVDAEYFHAVALSKRNMMNYLLLIQTEPWSNNKKAKIIQDEIKNVIVLKKCIEKEPLLGYNCWWGWNIQPEALRKKESDLKLALEILRKKEA